MSKPKNLIYLVMDSVRPDYLGCYGGDPLTTEIDRLAEDGVLFENVVSAAPWTVPSVAAHTTGVYPHNLKIFTPDIEVDSWADTLFERFSDAGYSTAVYFDSERRRRQFDAGVDTFGWSYDIESHLDYISEYADDQFVIFNLYRGTHLPYQLKYSRESWLRAKDELMEELRHGGVEGIEEVKYRYARSIEHFSEWYLRAYIDRLEDEGILEDTAVVVTSDHGEHWGKRLENQEDIDLFGLHGPHLYDEVLRVPLVMYNMGSAAGVRVDEMVRSVDVLPTILDAFDLPKETNAEYPLDGTSLYGCLEGREEDVEFPEFAISSTTNYGPTDTFTEPSERDLSVISKVSVVREPFKLIYTRDTDEHRLYHLKEDPGEETDISEERPDVAAELLDTIQAEIEETDEERSTEEREALQDRLEDLGYL